MIMFSSCSGELTSDLRKGLAGYWKLNGDAHDYSDNERHAEAKGDISFTAGGPDGKNDVAGFNGYNSWLEVSSQKAPQIGKNDFSVAVWVNIDENSDDVPGDIISKYDSVSRKGFHLSIKTNAVTTSLPNDRQIIFGIDNNQPSEWKDQGRPGNAICAFSLASYQGDLYAGTCEAGKEESGHVYRLESGNWANCGSPDKSNGVMALAEYKGKLYAGTAKYRLAGSSLKESENPNTGGGIYRYEGGQNWVYCGRLPQAEAIGGLIVYKGSLYGSSLYRPAGFYRYDGDTNWVDCGTPGGKRVVALGIYNGFIYATSYDAGFVYRYDGIKWTDCGELGDNTQTYSFAVYHGRLYVGTWPSGRVYRFEDINKWTDMGRLGNEKEVMGMLVHNGRLIAGTLPLAEVYSYEGDTIWKKITRLDNTPDVVYRRAWTMAEVDGKVFCSTLPSGKIFSFEEGRNVMSPGPLSPGWHHIAAIKSNGILSLYLDGSPVGKSEKFDTDLYDLSNDESLKIGFGSNDYFKGKMTDLRFYGRTLSEKEIRYLSEKK
jgi:hypothetical protein